MTDEAHITDRDLPDAENYFRLASADATRVQLTLNAVVARFDEFRESLPDFTRIDAMITAMHFVRNIVGTAVLDLPVDDPERRLFYDAAIATLTRRLERDRDEGMGEPDPLPQKDEGQ